MTKETENPEELYRVMDYNAVYSSNLPALFKHLNISLAFTSYQAGRLMLVRSDGRELDINFKTFPRPMGLAVTAKSLVLGTFTQVISFQREDGLLDTIKQPLPGIEEDITAKKISGKSEQASPDKQYERITKKLAEEDEEFKKQFGEWQQYQESLYAPANPKVDSCFITRSSHYSGMINIHDIEWGNSGLWAVNSSFSCLCTLEPDFSFVPRWKPSFITDLAPEDRCHLNGMALRDGEPAYVTTFSTLNKQAQWRKSEDKFSGTLMDVQANEILLDGLCMPHSPRWHQDNLYFCNSGLGTLCRFEAENQDQKILAEYPGFTRGMDFYGPLLFVGLSKVRQSDVTQPAPLAEKYEETFSGIRVFNLEDNSEAGYIHFTGNVDQIYDVAVIPGCSYPELIEPGHPRMRNHFCYPEL